MGAPLPPGGKKKGSTSLIAWAKKNPKLAAGGGALAGLGAIYLYQKNKGAASSTGGSPTTGSTATNPGAPVWYSNPNQDPSYGALEAQITRLQHELTRLTRRRKHDKPIPVDPHPKPRHPQPKPRRGRKSHGRHTTPQPIKQHQARGQGTLHPQRRSQPGAAARAVTRLPPRPVTRKGR